MGQDCCKASQNSPEIAASHQDHFQERTQENNPIKDARQLKDQNQKQHFYGKNGYKYSKTITKQIETDLDGNMQAYKKSILQKKPTIKQESQQDSITQSMNKSNKADADKSRKSQDAIQMFLDQLTEQISSKK